MAGLTATMVYNWRVLWWSLPQVQRTEHVLYMCVKSLRAHRTSGAHDEHWRMQYTFLGMNVCRDATITLTGLGASSLQAARDATLAGNVSWLSTAARKMPGGPMAAHSKAAAYLGARSWLEWYSESHAEMSPQDLRAYRPADRTCILLHS